MNISRGEFLCSHRRFKVCNRLFHDSCAFYNLGQKHFSRTKQISNDVHAIHQRAFDDMQWSLVKFSTFLNILINVIYDAMNKRMLEPFLDIGFSPCKFFNFRFIFLAQSFCKIDQAFGGVRPSIKQNVFNSFKKILGYIFVNLQLPCIYNTHV